MVPSAGQSVAGALSSEFSPLTKQAMPGLSKWPFLPQKIGHRPLDMQRFPFIAGNLNAGNDEIAILFL